MATLKWTGLLAFTAMTICTAPASAQEQRMEGIIVTHQHGQLTVKTPSGNQAVSLAPGVRVRSIAGALGGQKQVMPVSALIPGLPIVIDYTPGPGGQVVAHANDSSQGPHRAAFSARLWPAAMASPSGNSLMCEGDDAEDRRLSRS